MKEALDMETTFAVIIPACDIQRYNNLKKLIESLLQQSYKINEIIIVVNGSLELGKRLEVDYKNNSNIRIAAKSEFLGSAKARNIGIKLTSADIIAFTDDDSIADSRWIEKLVEIYRTRHAIAVGGKVLPVWLVNKPSFLPGELYWLIGATHEKIFEDDVIEVRNTFGPNMSFRRGVLESVGYFEERLGFNRSSSYRAYIGGEEQELGLRIIEKYGMGMIYNPEAIVHHEIPAAKIKLSTLIKRAFYFGVSKRIILRINRLKNNMDVEKSYLGRIIKDFIPEHISEIFQGPAHVTAVKKLAFLLLVVTTIGLGFMFGYVASK